MVSELGYSGRNSSSLTTPGLLFIYKCPSVKLKPVGPSQKQFGEAIMGAIYPRFAP